MMMQKRERTNKGQALVEFALIIVILLFIIFIILEGARLFQANLTVQNAARAAGRYAMTGQFDNSCLGYTPCDDPRVGSIKAVAEQQLAGLNTDNSVGFEDPGYYLIEVYGPDPEIKNVDPRPWKEDYAGRPGEPVLIRVSYRSELITPFLSSIARTVLVSGRVVVNNEELFQTANSDSGDEPPNLPTLPPPQPSPTPGAADLEIVKSAPAEVLVNTTFYYNLDVTHLGTSGESRPANNVVVTDTLPSGVSVIGALPAGCTHSGGEIVCTLATLDPAASHSFRFPVQASVGNTVITNTAVVASDVDPVPGNNSDEAATIVSVVPKADIAVEKGASASLLAPNDILIYTLSVVNNGFVDATGIQVQDVLPGSFDLQLVTTDPITTTTCSPTTGQGVTVNCNISSLAIGERATIILRGEVLSLGTISNQAEVVSSSPEDPDSSNNISDPVIVDVQNVSDLWLVNKTNSLDPGVGLPMTYTINIRNRGPADATGVQIGDSLPASVVYTGSSAGCTYDSGSHTVSCTVGNLPVDSAASAEIYVVPQQSGTVQNIATVNATEVDQDASNNGFTLNTFIRPSADMAITSVTQNPASDVESGQEVAYTIAVINNGPSNATGVTLRHNLPSDFDYVSSTSSQGACGQMGGDALCNLGPMNVGDTATVVVRAIPIVRIDDTFTSIISVSSNQADPITANNIWRHDTDVISRAFISLEPMCGDISDTILVNGYNWPVPRKNSEIEVQWVPNGTGTPMTLAPVTGQNPFPAEETWNVFVRVPTGIADGIHKIQAILDGDVNTAREATITVPCPAPNLVVSGGPSLITPTVPISISEPLVFTTTITNIGNLDAISQFFVGLYFNPPTPVSSTTHMSATLRESIVAVSGLGMGQSKTITMTVPRGFSQPITYTIYSVVDSDPAQVGVIDERTETDNISAALVLTATGSTTEVTPTVTPENPGRLFGQVLRENGNPQPETRVTLYDLNTGDLINETYSRSPDGFYVINGIAPGNYAVTACISIEEGGTQNWYFTSANVTISSGSRTLRNLVIRLAPFGCGP